MPRVTPADVKGSEMFRVAALRADIRDKWSELDAHIRFSGVLSSELKEEVRRSLAPGVGCVWCASLGDAKAQHVDPRESLAVAYAEQLRDPKQIDDSMFDVLREEFSDEEIVELTYWSLFMIAGQGFGAAMKIGVATDEDRDEYTEWRRRGEVTAAASTPEET